jgi:hypothetical protein
MKKLLFLFLLLVSCETFAQVKVSALPSLRSQADADLLYVVHRSSGIDSSFKQRRDSIRADFVRYFISHGINPDSAYYTQWETDSAISASSTGWNLQGNSSTNPATDFIGTADNKSLVFRTNNSERIRITSGGAVGINANPASTFDVDGDVYFHQGANTASAFNFDSARFSSVQNHPFGTQPNITTMILQGIGVSAFQPDTTENISIVVSDDLSGASTNKRLTIDRNGFKFLTENFVSSVLNDTAGQFYIDSTGHVTIIDGTQGANKILISDATGLSSWGNMDSIFTPVMIDSTNVDATTINDAMAIITGRLVTVQYSLYVTPNTTLTPTQIKISLPIPANPSATPAGQGVFEDTGGNASAIVKAVDANTISVDWTPVSTSSQLLNFSVCYRYQ